MARKSVEELEKELEAARVLEVDATEGLSVSQQAYEAAFEGIIDGTPEQLAELQSAFAALVAAIKSNWKYRGKPTQTEQARAKAILATKKSQARKAAREAALEAGKTAEQADKAADKAAKKVQADYDAEHGVDATVETPELVEA